MAVLDGGVRAWRKAGFAVVAPALPEAGDAQWAELFPECVCRHEGIPCEVLPVSGTVDHQSAPELLHTIRAKIAKEPPHIVLDLSKVERMDTAGIAVLIETTREAKEKQVCLSLTNPSSAVLGLMKVTRLEPFFPQNPHPSGVI